MNDADGRHDTRCGTTPKDETDPPREEPEQPPKTSLPEKLQKLLDKLKREDPPIYPLF